MKKLTKTQALDKNGKVWGKPEIQALLHTSDQAVYNALIRIYNRQTLDEKEVQQTRDWNTVGFTGVDGKIMSSFTESFKKYGKLTPNQMVYCRRKIKKYWRQLLDEMRNENPQMIRS